MKEGSYTLVFSADGHTAAGTVSWKKRMLLGRSGGYTLSGQVTEADDRLIGNVLVIRAPEALTDPGTEDRYLVPVTGTSNDDTFRLSGTGPLGLVVQMTGTWAGAYADGLSKLDGDVPA